MDPGPNLGGGPNPGGGPGGPGPGGRIEVYYNESRSNNERTRRRDSRRGVPRYETDRNLNNRRQTYNIQLYMAALRRFLRIHGGGGGGS